MAALSGNQCTIITIIPMEVECNVTNASTPTSSDGIAQVQVFGGTPPYSITWTNGITSQQGDTLSNLLPGTYSATVVDYFGDYSITTECVVGSASGVIYQFDSCVGFAAQTIYVSGSTYAPPFPNVKPIIKFNEIVDCWEFIGPISSLGLTYSALTVSNSYGNCSSCNPPTPTPLPQDTLCLTGINTNPALSQQYEFTANGTDSNGNYQWVDSANGLTMSYNISSGRWEVLTWTSIGGNIGNMVLTQSPPTSQPLGTWTNNGGNPKFTWDVAVGPCTGPPLSLTTSVSNPNCEGSNGSILMTASQGVPPYTYSIQGVSPTQSSGQFQGISPGSYVGLVTDSDTPSSTTTDIFIINNGLPSITYTLFVTKSNEVISNQASNLQVVTYDYSVTVSPALPNNVSLTFDLNFTHIETRTNSTSQGQITFFDLITGNLNGSPLTFTSTSPTTLNGNPSPYCPSPNTVLIDTFTTTTAISLTNTTTLTGTVTSSTDLNFLPAGSCACPIEATNKINVQANNIVISGGNCNSVVNNSNTESGESFQSGCYPLL